MPFRGHRQSDEHKKRRSESMKRTLKEKRRIKDYYKNLKRKEELENE